MSNYTKATNFTAKDSLTTGDPSKKVLGSELDTEYTAIEGAVASKANTVSPTFTGTVVLPAVTKSGTEVDSSTYNYGLAVETAAGTTYTLGLGITAYTIGSLYNVKFPTANTSTTPTLNINSLGAKTIVKEGSVALMPGDIPLGHEAILRYNGTNVVLLNPKWPSGFLLQVVNTQTGAVASGSTAIPVDDTVPQNSEGDEYMTLAITPKSSTSKLKIEVVVNYSAAAGSKSAIVALFQDATASALACSAASSNTAGGTEAPITFTHYMTSGTTSATTFKIRAACNDATSFTFNGASGARLFGGVFASSITITEYAP